MTKKKKSPGADHPAQDATQGDAGGGAAAATHGDDLIERAFRAGNYADVRALARTDGSARAQALAQLTHVDKGQLIVGLIALVVVLFVAVLTLK